MRQQINLYQDVLIDKPKPFVARHALAASVLVFVMLCCWAGFRYWQLKDLEDELLRLQQRQGQIQQQVVRLEEMMPNQNPDPLLLEKVSRLEIQIGEQKTVLNYFFTQDKDANRFVLASLQGLASMAQPDLWLRRISFEEEGERISLAGTALKAERVPEYLEALGSKHILGGRGFSQLQLKRFEKSIDRVDFELDTRQAAK